MKIYLAGPMTGYNNLNKDTFNRVAEKLRDYGHIVINPAEFVEPLLRTREEYLKIALRELCLCQCVAVLPDWQASWGAGLEVHVAQQLKIPVVPYQHIGENESLSGIPNALGLYGSAVVINDHTPCVKQ